MKKKLRKEKGLAIGEIILLIVSIIAISYVLGNSFSVVNAASEGCPSDYFTSAGDVSYAYKCDGNDKYSSCRISTGIITSGQDACGAPTGHQVYTQCCTSDDEGSEETPWWAWTPTLSFLTPVSTGSSTTATPPPVVPPAKKGTWKLLGGIAKDAGISLGIYFGGKSLLKLTGMSHEWADSLAASFAVGYATKTILLGTLSKLKILTISGPWGWVITGIAMLLTFIFTFKKTKYVVITFSCYPWDAPTGGEDCEECNKQDILSCGEYQCRSLGRSCAFLSNEELCYWNNTGDVDPPIIQPWEDILTPEYVYKPDDAISPPDRGVIIERESESGCVLPFTPLRFGVILNEPAKCKIDSDREKDFEDMSSFFGGSPTDKYNHSYTLSLPSPDALAEQNITLQHGGQSSLYVRCEDTQGNSNPANFVFKYCVDEGPDTFPPVIKDTSILNGMPIGFNQTSVDLKIYVNELVECRWSHLDKGYDDMETDMSCSTDALEMNAQSLYGCSTTLTGLKDEIDNNFYFRCEDQPHLEGTDRERDRNKNPSSYKFTLVGTRPLVINSVEPNETIRDSTDLVKVTLEVETSAGYKEGAASCYFSDTGAENSFVKFFETGTNEHTQDLWLPEGDYTYYIKCVDLGGNSDSATTGFTVESDSTPPVVVRIFRDGQNLKIITNEEAICVYDNINCLYDFDDGLSMTSDGKVHSTEWEPDKNFYIKCRDEFDNKPFPNQCSIIVRPFEI